MSRFFIHRPIFAIVIAIIITILGSPAIFSLPVAQYPKITQPTVSTSTSCLGANAGVINQTVAQVIGQRLNGTQGMDYMSPFQTTAALTVLKSSSTSTQTATWTPCWFKIPFPSPMQACPPMLKMSASRPSALRAI